MFIDLHEILNIIAYESIERFFYILLHAFIYYLKKKDEKRNGKENKFH